MNEYVRQATQLNKPLSSRLSKLDFELTERCNNSCIHCYINRPKDDHSIQDREMSTAFIKDILRQAVDLGCLQVRFTGGEPLLRDDFIELYTYARQLGLKVLIFTNACLITPELAQLFANIPPGKPIEVSVYGMSSDSYEAVTSVKGAFKQFCQGVTLLQRHDIPFVVKQSLLPQNRHELAEFETFAADLPYMKNKPDYTMKFDLRARRDDEAKNRRIRRLRLSPEETLAMITREPVKYLENTRKFAGKFMGPPGDKIFSCGAGSCPTIDAYGNVQMCLLLRHPETLYSLDLLQHTERNPATNLLPLEYALTKFFPQIHLMRSNNPEYLRRCALCFLKGFCDQCPAKSWEEYGTLDTPVEYLCQVTHTQAAYLGLVLEGERSWELETEVWQTRLKAFTCGTKA